MTFGFLLFPDLEELDFVGPWEIINVWRMFFGGPECVTVSENGGVVACAKGLKVFADYNFENCPRLDYLLIPGGRGTRTEVNNKKLIEFVQAQSLNCKHITSVCTGSFILQAAGLLKERKATTHWGSLDRLRSFEDVRVDEKRFVRDGNIWTAAGVSAGIDLALALVAEEAGEEIAGEVQFYVEYYPSQKRYGSAHKGDKSPAYLKE